MNRLNTVLVVGLVLAMAGVADARRRNRHRNLNQDRRQLNDRPGQPNRQPAPAGCRIRFLGGAGTVTGSMHVLETNGHRLVVDCGLFQGAARRRFGNRPMPREAVQADCMLLTHAHIDHSGNIPLLVKAGYRGKIHCTRATADLCKAMLVDSARVQEREASKANRDRPRGEPRKQPAYTVRDAERALALFKPHAYNESFKVLPGVSACFSQAGHVLGAASAAVDLKIGTKDRRVVFSGDIGRRDSLILPDPKAPARADYVVMESTYGNRTHAPTTQMKQQLADTIRGAAQRGGKVVIPAFTLQRTQELVFLLNQLGREGRLGNLPVFVDSPLAAKLTDVFRRHTRAQGPKTHEFSRRHGDPYSFPNLKLVSSPQESHALRRMNGPAVVISSPGMPKNGGRILGHLKAQLTNPRNTVAIVGYQAAGTLGRQLVEGARTLRINGHDVAVRAQVRRLDAFSAHGDRNDLLWWARSCGPQVKKFFVVHGDPDQSSALAGGLRQQGQQAVTPSMGQTVELQ